MPQCDNLQRLKPRLSNDKVWPKPDNFKEEGMPQYQRCIMLLECQMKQAVAYIIVRKKVHFMIKVLKRYEHESFYILNKFFVN